MLNAIGTNENTIASIKARLLDLIAIECANYSNVCDDLQIEVNSKWIDLVNGWRKQINSFETADSVIAFVKYVIEDGASAVYNATQDEDDSYGDTDYSDYLQGALVDAVTGVKDSKDEVEEELEEE